MMRHAITQMDTQEDYLEEENDCHLLDATNGGSTFDVRITAEVDRPRTKSVICMRLDSNQKNTWASNELAVYFAFLFQTCRENG